MMSYENFEIEDFVHDDFFIDSVLRPVAEHDEFWQEWLLQFPERKAIWEKASIIVSYIGTQAIPEKLSDLEVDSIVNYVQKFGYGTVTINHQTGKFYHSSWFRLAASLLLLVAAGIVFYASKRKENSQDQALASNTLLEYKNVSNQAKLIRMNDSSLAILMPNTSLRYPKAFTKLTREVYLDGEAFFEIHRNPSRPFLVHSKNMVTKVLGTSFTVKAYSQNNEFSVIVNTGKVLVYNQTPLNDPKHLAVTLIPHQQATLRQSLLIKDTIATPMMLAKETAKKEFTFNNTPVSAVIQKLEMAYHVKIAYDENQIGNSTLTASLSNLPLDEKVKLICKAINAQCNFTDGQIFIEKKPEN